MLKQRLCPRHQKIRLNIFTHGAGRGPGVNSASVKHTESKLCVRILEVCIVCVKQ